MNKYNAKIYVLIHKEYRNWIFFPDVNFHHNSHNLFYICMMRLLDNAIFSGPQSNFFLKEVNFTQGHQNFNLLVKTKAFLLGVHLLALF